MIYQLQKFVFHPGAEKKPTALIHGREKEPILLIHVREKKHIALIHVREKDFYNLLVIRYVLHTWNHAGENPNLVLNIKCK